MRQNPPTENGPVVRFYLRDAMLARVHVSVHVVCLVTSRCSIETTKRIKLAFGVGA